MRSINAFPLENAEITIGNLINKAHKLASIMLLKWFDDGMKYY